MDSTPDGSVTTRSTIVRAAAGENTRVGYGSGDSTHLDPGPVVGTFPPSADPLLHVAGQVLEPRPPTLVDHQHGLGLAGDGVVRSAP